MNYTYTAYRNLMILLLDNGYSPIRFCDVTDDIECPAIIRHDIDIDLDEAIKMAELEWEIGIKSTYFIMLSSDYYNIFSGRNMKNTRKILDLGHEIGLHFDITAYEKNMSMNKLEEVLRKEISILECGLNIKIKSISWHIPRQDLLGIHLNFTDEMNIYNAYDPIFFNGYKYVSDSMMQWREPVEKYIEKKQYRKLQILTHPIWYSDIQDLTDEQILEKNKEKHALIENIYLNTIKPGFFIENQ